MKGTATYTEYYDYKNKRLRRDYPEKHYRKIYRYDQPSSDHKPFPAPKGYKVMIRAIPQ